ncbi:MAG: signal peptidase II [Anaerolineales bacterium]
MSKVRDYTVLFLITGTIVAFDQLTKWLVRSNLAVGEFWSPFPWLTPYARFIHWKNTGAAFGLFPAGGTIFMVVAVIVSAAIIYYFPQIPSDKIWYRLALGMQLSGALGNLIDRVLFGPVTDFVSVGRFAVFNVADASISVGTAILIIAMWIDERQLARDRESSNGQAIQDQMPSQEQTE